MAFTEEFEYDEIRMLTKVQHPACTAVAKCMSNTIDLLEKRFADSNSVCDPLGMVLGYEVRSSIIDIIKQIDEMYGIAYEHNYIDDVGFVVDVNDLYEAFSEIHSVYREYECSIGNETNKSERIKLLDNESSKYLQTIEFELRDKESGECTMENKKRLEQIATEAKREMGNLIGNIYRFDEGLFSVGERMLVELGGGNIGSLRMMLKQGCLKFARRYHKKYYEYLMQEVEDLKTTSSEYITREHWGKLMDRMKERLSDHSGCADEVRKYMDGVFCVIRRDNELIDLDRLVEKITDPMAINSGNLRHLYQLVLEHNIICRELFKEEVEAKYDAWINGGVVKEIANRVEKKEKKDPLRSEKAMAYWRRLQDEGWVDEELKPLVSWPKAAMIASVLGEKLGLNPAWSPFEKLWGVSDLASQFCKAQVRSYYDSFLKELRNILK